MHVNASFVELRIDSVSLKGDRQTRFKTVIQVDSLKTIINLTQQVRKSTEESEVNTTHSNRKLFQREIN